MRQEKINEILCKIKESMKAPFPPLKRGDEEEDVPFQKFGSEDYVTHINLEKKDENIQEKEKGKTEDDNKEEEENTEDTETENEDDEVDNEEDSEQNTEDVSSDDGSDETDSVEGSDSDLDTDTSQGMEEEKLSVEEIGRVYELKKIYKRLLSIETYLSNTSDLKLLYIRKTVSKAIEIFDIISSNIEQYIEKIDDIIVLYYRFLLVCYKLIKKYLAKKEVEDEKERKK